MGRRPIFVRQTAIQFASDKLALEGVLSVPDGLSVPLPAMVVCHPHPLLGGDMENPVVMAICRGASERGIATLRFNFRGAGGSEGEFSKGEEEPRDVAAALDVLRRWPGIDRKQLALAGYSFGASMVLGGLKRYKAAGSLVLVAPPLSALRDSPILKDSRPKLFVVGRDDRLVPPAELQRELDGIRGEVRFSEIVGADHILGGHEGAVAERVVEFLSETL